jgi:endo-1,4-beta-mannosidase
VPIDKADSGRLAGKSGLWCDVEQSVLHEGVNRAGDVAVDRVRAFLVGDEAYRDDLPWPDCFYGHVEVMSNLESMCLPVDVADYDGDVLTLVDCD